MKRIIFVLLSVNLHNMYTRYVITHSNNRCDLIIPTTLVCVFFGPAFPINFCNFCSCFLDLYNDVHRSTETNFNIISSG